MPPFANYPTIFQLKFQVKTDFYNVKVFIQKGKYSKIMKDFPTVIHTFISIYFYKRLRINKS
jgi:hypothetical protein